MRSRGAHNDRVSVPRWTVFVPLRSTLNGKRRLALPAPLRQRLALSMAQDTVHAALTASAVAQVIIVLETAADAAAFKGLAAVHVHQTDVAGLNEAIADGVKDWNTTHLDRIAVLPADLPSLTGTALDEALRQARDPLSVVPDADGTGTTLLAARARDALELRYGPGSFALHRAAGAVEIEVPAASGLRRDVDRVVDLDGVTGPRTRAVLEAEGMTLPLLARRCG